MFEGGPRTAFGQRLKGWREDRALSQAAVDEAIEKTRGFTAQIETGRLKPPPREVCDKYDLVLQLPSGSVWRAAAPERLRDFDEALWIWHREQIDAAAGLHITPDEQRLLEVVRQFAVRDVLADGRALFPDVSATLAAVLETFLEDSQVPAEVLGEGRRTSTTPSSRLEPILRDLQSMSLQDQQTLWFLFEGQVRAWKTRVPSAPIDPEVSISTQLSDGSSRESVSKKEKSERDG